MDLQRKFEPMPSAFDRQFEMEDGRLVYRRYQKGPAIPLSDDERVAFKARFKRDSRRMMIAMMLGMLAAIVAFAWYAAVHEIDTDQTGAIYVVLIPLFAAYVAAQLRLYTYPARALSGRTPVAGARSRSETQRIAARQSSWTQLVLGLMILVAFSTTQLMDPTSTTGWRWVWGGLMMFGVIAGGRSAFLKWRLGRSASGSVS